MSGRNYRCYGCGTIVKYNDLSAECMCIHEKEPKYRGVCIDCKDKKFSDYKEKPDHDHNLRKIHKYAEGADEYWKMVERECPGWSELTYDSNGKVIFSYLEGPNGESKEELYKLRYYDGKIKDIHEHWKRKSLHRPPNNGSCVCCD